MKKVLVILLAFAMIFSFAACGGDGGNGGQSGEGEGDAAPLKVGFIYIGSAQDGGFSQAQDEGRAAMVEYFGGKVETVVQEEVHDQDAQATETAARNMIDQGCKVIVGTSFGYMDTLERLAEEFPDIYFLHFSGNKMNDTNFDNYFGAMEEPRYLSGIVAGMMTQSNKIGYVAAYPYTEVQIGINAFALGVQSVNKDAEVKVVYINSWYDPANEKAAAESLLAQGCDVLAQHCDTLGPIIAAENAGKYAIGYNLDKQDAAPGTFLTAPIWNHEVYYIQAIQSIMDGTFKPQSYYGHMSDGYLDLAPLNPIVSEEAKAKVEEVKAKILDGSFAPFSGKIEYADGTTLCEEGQTLTRAEIWSINNVIKGVTATDK